VQQRWHLLKDDVPAAASNKALPIRSVNGALDALRAALKMAEQLTKAATRLDVLGTRVAAAQAAQH